MTIKVDQKTSYICFEEGTKITVNDFIEKIRGYYEKKRPNIKEHVKLSDLENKEKVVTKYKINIIFPQNTIFRPTEGGQLLVKEANGIIEIYEQNKEFENYEMFSMDEKTVAKRAWVSKDDMRIGLILKKNIYEGDKAQIGFQAEGGSITINKDEDYTDPLIEMLKIDIEQINNEEKQQDSNST